MKMVAALGMVALALIGCGDRDISPAAAQASSTSPPKAPPPSRVFTRDDWVRTFESTLVKRDSKTNGEGVTEFLACFDPQVGGKKCGIFAIGRSDAFRKTHALTLGRSHFYDIADLNSFPLLMVIASECGAPDIVISPRFNSKGGWLFLNHVAFMADGAVVLEHSFESHQVKRDNDYGWVHERVAWVASSADLAALRKITAAQTTITRFTGEKAYYTVQKNLQAAFIEDTKDALRILDRLNAAFDKVGGSDCTPASAK